MGGTRGEGRVNQCSDRIGVWSTLPCQWRVTWPWMTALKTSASERVMSGVQWSGKYQIKEGALLRLCQDNLLAGVVIMYLLSHSNCGFQSTMQLCFWRSFLKAFEVSLSQLIHCFISLQKCLSWIAPAEATRFLSVDIQSVSHSFLSWPELPFYGLYFVSACEETVFFDWDVNVMHFVWNSSERSVYLFVGDWVQWVGSLDVDDRIFSCCDGIVVRCYCLWTGGTLGRDIQRTQFGRRCWGQHERWERITVYSVTSTTRRCLQDF